MVSPNNLQLDSEPSNIAEWSLSMATPTNRGALRGTPLALPTTGTSTATEDESEGGMTTDESILEARCVLRDTLRHVVKKGSSRRQLGPRGGKVSEA